MHKIINFFIVILFASLAGCSSAPINNKDFGNITKISDLNGTYLNKGDTGNNVKIYLSRIVWPNDKTLKHESINSIIVKAINSTQLQVSAIQNQSTIKEQIFTKEIEFNIDSGRINLNRKIEMVNDNMAGLGYQNTVLGIDTLGNGKYVNSGAFVGIALLIPLAVYATEDVRFLRIK